MIKAKGNGGIADKITLLHWIIDKMPSPIDRLPRIEINNGYTCPATNGSKMTPRIGQPIR